jgi:hypothetical protein
MHSAKVLPFPTVLTLECRACGDLYDIGVGYDLTQDRLCPPCVCLKAALAEKRMKVPHQALDGTVLVGILILAVSIVGTAIFITTMIQAAIRR